MSRYTKSPLGLIEPGTTNHDYKSGNSIFSSKHRFISYNNSQISESPLSFGTPNEIHSLNEEGKGVYDIKTSNIIERLKDIPSMALKWSDFAYCRDYGVYPNNRLIVCRRFNEPVLDDLTFYGLNSSGNTAIQPITTLISWYDDKKEVIEFSFSEQWVDAETSFTNLLNNAGDDIGLGKIGIKLGDDISKGLNIVPLPGATEKFQRQILERLGIVSQGGSEIIPSGTPNLIKEAKQRKLISDKQSGSGLTGKFNIKVSCSWEQKFISGVDPTFVYYDILRTVLTFGGSEAVFYLGKRSNLGGLGKFFQDFIKDGSIAQIGKIIDSIQESVKKIAKRIGEVFEGLINQASSAGMSSEDKEKEQDDVQKKADEQAKKASEKEKDLLTRGLNELTNIIESFADTLIKKYRVIILGIVSSLTGLPSTPWHVTIGNPLRPIFSSGDMECSSVTVKLGSQLSFNDLPSYIECEFTLSSARNLGTDEIFEKLSNTGIRVVNEGINTTSTDGINSFWSQEIEVFQKDVISASQSRPTDFTAPGVLEGSQSDTTKVGNVDSGTSVNPDANSENTTN